MVSGKKDDESKSWKECTFIDNRFLPRNETRAKVKYNTTVAIQKYDTYHKYILR